MPNLKARALALFDEYIEMGEPQRARALEALKAQDPELHDELAALLAADSHSPPPSLLSTPFEALGGADAVSSPAHAPASAGPDPRLGSRLGPWRIDSVIGAGGMGTVYQAQRVDGQYEQTVALKCLRAGLYSPLLEAAFRHERNTLAQLDHPNIARLVDGGIDEQGHPWFAMQKIDGLPIDRWCDQQRLSLRERVQLLLQACTAIAYAHDQGVLHQDIKPSNLLVGEDGRPMLLDFGLTEMLSQEARPGRARFAASSGYTAPEALSETTPSPAGDIYATGVVLYRLLCAGWPAPPRGYGVPAPVGLEAPAPPRAPSAVALQATEHAARVRGAASPAALSRQLSGDLDCIALRCVALDPAARYGSIRALQADLQDWLARRPVRARNGGVAYRLHRFVQRNTLVTALAAVSLLALGTTAGFGLWQWQQARQESALALALAEAFERIPGGASLPEWGDTPLNLPVALQASEQGLRQQFQSNPTALSRGLLAVARGYVVIGDHARALALIEEARRIDPGDMLEQARAQAALAGLHNAQAGYAKAEQAAREGVDALGKPLGPAAKSVLASLYGQIARARWQMADHAAAQSLLDDTLRVIQANPDRYPAALQAELLALRSDWNNQLRRFDAGRADAERAIALGGTSQTTANAQEQLSAAMRETGSASEGMDAIRANLQRLQRQLGPDHPETGFAWIVLAEALQAAGDAGPALQASRQALRILTPALGADHPYIARALRIGALAQAFDGQPRAAVEDARRALSIMESAYGSRHYQTVLTRQVLAATLGSLSQSDPRPEYREQALSQYQRLLRDGEALGLPMGRQWLAYGIRLTNSGQTAEARRALQRALPLLEQEGSEYVFEVRRNLAVVALKEKRYDEARTLLESSAARLRSQTNRSLYRTTALSDTLLDLSQLELEQNHPERAREHLQEALRIGEATFGADDPQTRAIRAALDNFDQDAS